MRLCILCIYKSLPKMYNKGQKTTRKVCMQVVHVPCEFGKVGRDGPAANDTAAIPTDADLSDMVRFALDGLLEAQQVGNVSHSTEGDMNMLVSQYSNQELVAFMRTSHSKKNEKPAFYRAVRSEARRRGIVFL